MISAQRYTDPLAFHKRVAGFLTKHEAENNLPIGVLEACLNEPVNPEHIFIALEKDAEVVFIMMQTFKRMILVGALTYIEDAIDYLIHSNISPAGIIGEYELGQAFAAQWAARQSCSWNKVMDQRIYKLDQVQAVPVPSGSLRKASSADYPILRDWIQSFYTEAAGSLRQVDADKILPELIQTEALYVWEDGPIVSMVRKTRPSPNGIVVTLVYTPPEHRKKGYATACVYAFSKILLEEYQFCTLYTDLANPTSNSIYMKIGYRPIIDSIVIDFQAN